MSVDLYVKKSKEGIAKKIQDNLDFIKSNPYPLEQLNAAASSYGANSSLAKMFDSTGKKDVPPEIMKSAKDEASTYPNLWTSLLNGNKSLKREKENILLAKADPAKSLKDSFSKFISELNKATSLGSSIKLDDVFSDKTSKDEFEDLLYSTNMEGVSSFGADDLVQSAFAELYKVKSPTSKEAAPQSAPINTTDLTTKPGQESKISPINSTKSESKEKVSSTSAESGITSKSGELSEDSNIDKGKVSPEININISQLEKKPELTLEKSASAEPVKLESATPSALASSTKETSTNTINSTSKTSESVSKIEAAKPSVESSVNLPIAPPAQSTVSNLSNSSNSSISTEQPSTLNNSTGAVTANTVNNTETKTSKFFSKVGKAMKSVGSALNLPALQELGKMVGGPTGSAKEGITSNVSGVTNASSNSSINNISNTSTASSIQESPKSTLDSSSNTKVSSNNTVSVNNAKSNLSVEQSKPSVSSKSESSSSKTENINLNSPTTVSNNEGSQNTSITSQQAPPEVTQVSQEKQSSSPAAVSGGTMVDMSELTKSIARLERILISGIEVTIKDI